MFDIEFYPTQIEVIQQIDADYQNKIVLEPSAGSGNIVQYALNMGAKQVIACEKNEDLRQILKNKCSIIANDFFTVKAENISHINMIVMNPPFSNADRHILHAWEIAPEGCEIYALCNTQTVDNKYSTSRKSLSYIIDNHGDTTDLGDCFSTAERKTNVNITLVKLFKPVITNNDFDFSHFFTEEEVEENQSGIMKHDEIRAIVSTYVSAVKEFDVLANQLRKINNITKHVGYHVSLDFGDKHYSIAKEKFTKDLQKTCWKKVFEQFKLEKMVTSGVKKDINKFIEQRSNYPFTMKNIYRMIEIIIGTREQTMDRAIVEIIDHYTRYTHENRWSVPGWKTNDCHMLGQKFIVNYACDSTCNGMLRHDYQGEEKLTELLKVVCYCSGKNYDDITSLQAASALKIDGIFIDKNGEAAKSAYDAQDYNRFEPNTWYENEIFKFKFFKKRTGHFMFKNESDWIAINRRYAKIKGEVLPEKIK